ncbi:MAG: hypothetical protein LBU46_01830, partial [Candidatus Accumulibacter sp.]|nr:hypothetical protein [Accumulibacter sp.]
MKNNSDPDAVPIFRYFDGVHIMLRKTFTYCFHLSVLAVTLSSASLLVAGCVQQQLVRSSPDNNGTAVNSGASVSEKPSRPKVHVTAPIIPIPIKNIEVSSNVSNVGYITDSSPNTEWCSATGDKREHTVVNGKYVYLEKNDTARWIKIYFDGVQTLNSLKFHVEWGGDRFTLSFSDGSQQTTEKMIEFNNLIPLEDKETEWVKIQYLDTEKTVYGGRNGKYYKYVNNPDRRICLDSLSFTGRDKNAPLAGAPETVVQAGDDRMPFEAGSFVWKGGKE